jgi:hypothetical protein
LAAAIPFTGWAASGTKLGRKVYKAVNGVVSYAVHEALKGSRLHDPAARLAHFLGFTACFTGDVKLARRSWGEGWKRSDEITIDDEVLSRDEHDPAGPLAWKRVEETFERVGMVYELEVTGGRVIPTTAEHPFYVVGKGWTAAGELRPGDQLIGLKPPEYVTVTALRSTGRLDKLYNLGVADYHTYCVGDDDWAFAVWAHNADYGLGRLGKQERLGQLMEDPNTPRQIHDWLRQEANAIAHEQ